MASKPSRNTLPTVVKVGYSEDKFYTDSTDSKGHYEEIRVKVPPNMMAIIEKAVELYGLDSKQAFMRDSLVHRSHYLANNPNGLLDPAMVEREITMAEYAAIIKADKDVKEQVEQAREAYARCVESEDWTRLNSVIERCQLQIENTPTMPEGHRAMLEAVCDEGWEFIDTHKARQRRKQGD